MVCSLVAWLDLLLEVSLNTPEVWLCMQLSNERSVGINGSLIAFLVRPVPEGYGFNGNAVGLIYFAPMIAVVCGELFGHFVGYPSI